ncbi:MAG: hypothetical protein HYY04_00140 [Chloroflexi bacterium]|nr:hypothetical protein [Chloroflexota bacterium]
MAWVYLTTAPNQVIGELWIGLLAAGGIDAMIEPGDAASFLGVSPRPCRILVVEDQLPRARAVLAEATEPGPPE